MNRLQKNVPVTFSLPLDLNRKLHSHVKKMELSKFVSLAIEEKLDEERKKFELQLEAEYEAASKDPERLEMIKDWDAIEDFSDIADEDWSWMEKSNG